MEPRGYVVGWIIAISLLVGILIFLLLAVLLWKVSLRSRVPRSPHLWAPSPPASPGESLLGEDSCGNGLHGAGTADGWQRPLRAVNGVLAPLRSFTMEDWATLEKERKAYSPVFFVCVFFLPSRPSIGWWEPNSKQEREEYLWDLGGLPFIWGEGREYKRRNYRETRCVCPVWNKRAISW